MKEITKYLISNYNKVKINSQNIVDGDVFIALVGKKTHGNEYILDALNNGAKYIVTDRLLKKSLIRKNIFIVDDTLSFLLKIATYKRSLFNGKIIGITGSVGKTSVKENLKYFLSSFLKVSASIKSYNNFLGVMISLINIDLLSDFAIFEIGTNNFSEIKELTSIIQPSQIIITNIFPTHLDKLINTRNIAIEKSDIFNPKYNPKVELIILPNNNIDEEFIIKLAKNKYVSNIFTFGNNPQSNLKISNIKKINKNFSKLSLNYKNEIIHFKIDNNQLYRVNNFLICFLIFKYNNFDINTYITLAKNVPLLKGRGKLNKIILNSKKVNFIDESYNASPETMKLCVNYFSDLKPKKNQKKYLILGDMKELGEKALNFHIELLDYITLKKIENVIICGELMQLALDKLDNDKILCMLNKQSIFKYLQNNLNINDIVLIKGSNSSLTNKLSKELLKKGDF